MIKELFLFFLVLCSPLLFIVGLLATFFFFFLAYETYVLPIQKQIKYSSNSERLCEQRADPVRVRVDNITFAIPADIFYRKSLTHCWGGSGVGPVWGCSYGQDVKVFEDLKTGETVIGYCQKETDDPFRVDILDLDFTALNPDGLILNLKAEGKPNLKVSINKIRIREYDYYQIGEYCRGFNKNILRATERDEIIMFDNPVYLEWYNKEKSIFTYKSLLGEKVLVHSLQTIQHLKDIPKSYWQSYFSQIEYHIKQYVKNELKSNFSSTCSKFLENNNNGRTH